MVQMFNYFFSKSMVVVLGWVSIEEWVNPVALQLLCSLREEDKHLHMLMFLA